MPPVEEVIPASELRQEPPPFVPSQAGNAAPMDDNAVRAIFAQAASDGIDDLNASVQLPGPMGEPAPAPAPVSSIPEVPAKFQKPDGTVDEEKLKASTTRLNEVVQEKVRTVDELAAEYRELQKKLGSLGDQEGQLKKDITQAAQVPPLGQVPPPNQDMESIRQQLLQLQRTDPIGFAVAIAREVARKEATDIAEPALRVAQNVMEQERDAAVRKNISDLGEKDARFFQLYDEVLKEIQSEPGYQAMKNPHKAAWNEVKERLRLGEAPARVPAQPSMTPSPTLGRGSPTPVSGLAQPQTPQTLSQHATNLNPYSEEGRKFEDQLREMSKQLGPMA